MAVLSWRLFYCFQGPGPCPFCLPSTFPTSPPHCPPPPTPRGSWFRFAVESLRGLIPSSVTLHPCGKYSSTSGLSPRGHLERQAEFHASTQDEA